MYEYTTTKIIWASQTYLDSRFGKKEPIPPQTPFTSQTLSPTLFVTYNIKPGTI